MYSLIPGLTFPTYQSIERRNRLDLAQFVRVDVAECDRWKVASLRVQLNIQNFDREKQKSGIFKMLNGSIKPIWVIVIDSYTKQLVFNETRNSKKCLYP